MQIKITTSSSVESPQVNIGVEHMSGDVALSDIVQTDGTQIILSSPQVSKFQIFHAHEFSLIWKNLSTVNQARNSNTSAASKVLPINILFIVAAALASTFGKNNSFKLVSILVISFLAIVNAQMYDTNSPYYTVRFSIF